MSAAAKTRTVNVAGAPTEPPNGETGAPDSVYIRIQIERLRAEFPTSVNSRATGAVIRYGEGGFTIHEWKIPADLPANQLSAELRRLWMVVGHELANPAAGLPLRADVSVTISRRSRFDTGSAGSGETHQTGSRVVEETFTRRVENAADRQPIENEFFEIATRAIARLTGREPGGPAR